MRSVDLNSDLGEGAGSDELIMPLITSANIACGAHAGDARTMREAVALAVRYGVAVGAHPGYPDRENFGRVAMDMPAAELLLELRRQIEGMRAIARQQGAAVTHVKAHGALYNKGERDDATAEIIAQAVIAVDPKLVLFAPPGSAMERVASDLGLRVAREGFVDRAYEADGTLRPRRLEGALHTEPGAAAAQAVSLARDGRVRAHGGGEIPLAVDTLCLHGDTPGAPAIARAVRESLLAAQVATRSFAPR